ncbi:MAG TPA: glycosyltransferase [Tepidisphaeraceae bacterium]|jgi:GT2 family glycosyltransferase
MSLIESITERRLLLRRGAAQPALPETGTSVRASVRGKFLFTPDQKLYVRGVTYGPFRPDEHGCEYGTPARVREDFQKMAERGINAVRVYTVPPRWLLDIAHQEGLGVMVGLPWEQHITFLDTRARRRSIEQRVREGVRACAGHPAILSFAIGNEIPANIVRWYGARRVERFLERLYRAAKAEDPAALVTYVNYPSTEYLQLPFLDFICFNVYLETKEKLESYLARLQNIAADRPLIIGEVGLDSLRNGADVQASMLEWQIDSIFASGAAGAFVFAWTDEWHRGGHDVLDWEFGLTTRDRQEKPALETVCRSLARAPLSTEMEWPLVSVVVCTYNGSRTIRECLEGLRRLEYPHFEVIVVDDGSRDGVGEIVRQYDVRLIQTENRGLSNARNTGMMAARGEIVAYIDDDASPDPHWLNYLALKFKTSSHMAVGGPNIAPPGDGMIADCVAHAPGGPIHVLLTDELAEHIPGCNMAFRRSALIEIGGFDPSLRIAGDDVDICWRIQAMGWTIGFAPAAMVWHRRRNSARAYWRQQFHYGRAEAMLERKWPGKYNTLGHPSWSGRVYGRALLPSLGWKQWRIYHGTWGSALFQSVYHSGPGTMASLPHTPEWYLIILVLALMSILSFAWSPLVVMLPLAVFAAAVPMIAGAAAVKQIRPDGFMPKRELWKRRLLVWWLHLMQPASRLLGRVTSGLTPLRFRRSRMIAFPRPRTWALWSETWRSATDRLTAIESKLNGMNIVTSRGGDYDDWDLKVLGGPLGAVRLKMTIEEHGCGKQMIRLQVRPTATQASVSALFLLGGLGSAIVIPGMHGCIVFALVALLLAGVAIQEMATAMGAVCRVIGKKQR